MSVFSKDCQHCGCMLFFDDRICPACGCKQKISGKEIAVQILTKIIVILISVAISVPLSLLTLKMFK